MAVRGRALGPFLLAACALTGLSCAMAPSRQVSEPPPPPPSPWEMADARALSTPPSAEDSIGSLSTYLTEGLPSDELRVRALFRWVAGHIRYDLQGFRAGDYGDLSPDGVLRRRRAVCEGYSGLFQALVESAGIEVATIKGFAKGVGFAAGDPVPATFNHAWNAVKVGGGWRLLDCTWAAGALDDQGRYVEGFDPFYFFTPPEQFIFSHYPENPSWQMLPSPITRAEFEALPQVKPAFFTCGLAFVEQPKRLLAVREPPVLLPLTIPSDVSVRAFLMRGETPLGEGYVRTTREGDRALVEALLPEPVAYVLRLFVAKGQKASQLDWAMDLVVTAQNGSGATTFKPGPGKKGTGKMGAPSG